MTRIRFKGSPRCRDGRRYLSPLSGPPLDGVSLGWNRPDANVEISPETGAFSLRAQWTSRERSSQRQDRSTTLDAVERKQCSERQSKSRSPSCRRAMWSTAASRRSGDRTRPQMRNVGWARLRRFDHGDRKGRGRAGSAGREPCRCARPCRTRWALRSRRIAGRKASSTGASGPKARTTRSGLRSRCLTAGTDGCCFRAAVA